MCPGWSTTKKHYDRMMEINYRQAKYIQMLSVLYKVTGGLCLWYWQTWIHPYSVHRRVTGAMAELDLEDESNKSVLARLVSEGGGAGGWVGWGGVGLWSMEWFAYRLTLTFSWRLSLESLLSSEKGEEVRQGVDGAGDHGHGLVGSRLRHHRFCSWFIKLLEYDIPPPPLVLCMWVVF